VPRLWSRFGIRAFAVGLLVLGLVGGMALGIDRKTQQNITAAGQAAVTEADDIHQFKLDQAAAWRAGAGQRAAQADAQAKANAAASTAAAKAKAADDAARTQAASRSNNRPSPGVGPIPSSCAVYTGNQAIGCTLLLQASYGLSEMPCLVNMWNKESHWRTTAKNSGSGAYGIPQALPASKMAVYGSDYLTNPVPQIKWGLNYIKNRYNSPCGAWSFWQAHGWY
jgi:hypothetical protein